MPQFPINGHITLLIKGSSCSAPDALSHYPVSDPQIEDALAEYDDQQNPEVSTMEIRAITAAEPLTTECL